MSARASDWQPRGEALRKAVRFLSSKQEDEPDRHPSSWVEEATVRFDLNPAQGEWLLRFARDLERQSEPPRE